MEQVLYNVGAISPSETSHGVRKWLRRWGVNDLLELSGNAMQCVMIEERLLESLRKNWEDVKRTKLEYYIANVNPECWSQYKAKMPTDHGIQPYLITNMTSNAHRALTLLHTQSHKLGIEVAS